MLREHGRIVECASIRNGYGETVFYAAVQNNETASYAPGETWAMVVLMWRGRGDFNFTYKEMSETMGPGDHDAPANVLDALTPTDNEWANEWRQACREKIAKKAAAPKVKPGDTVRFERPFSFSDGVDRDTFTVVQRSTLRGQDGTLVRIPNWRRQAFTVVGKAA